MVKENKFLLWFDQLTIDDVPLVGGKNASLGEMYQNLTKKGVKVPNGFAITAFAYRYIVQKAGIDQEIKNVLRGLDTKNITQLQEQGRKVRELIRAAPIPKEIHDEISIAYKTMCKLYGRSEERRVGKECRSRW